MINWAELFQMQKELDDRIIAEHGLQDVDLIPKRVVAFLVELSEFANEARFFKFWSTNQKPKRSRNREKDVSGELFKVIEQYDPLLEEFVDAVHFAVGIGLELGFTSFHEMLVHEYTTIPLDELYILICSSATTINATYYAPHPERVVADEEFEFMLDSLLAMGKKLAITDDEIVQAYKAKHAENHARQDRGY